MSKAQEATVWDVFKLDYNEYELYEQKSFTSINTVQPHCIFSLLVAKVKYLYISILLEAALFFFFLAEHFRIPSNPK